MFDRDRCSYCAACSAQYDGDPPCSGCEYEEPDLPDDCVAALDVFLACRTQLRVGFSGPIGLDYTAAKIVAETLRIPWTELLLAQLQVCEQAMIEAIAKQQPKQDP